jgi:hypothetical protein
VKSAQALFDQMAMNRLHGRRHAEQGRDVMSGETLAGQLTEQKRVKFITRARRETPTCARSTRGTPPRSSRPARLLLQRRPEARLRARHRQRPRPTIDADSDAELVAQESADLDFAVQGDRSLLKELRAGGRPVLTLAAPKSKAGDPRPPTSAVADAVRLFWRETGRDLERAEANGNVELLVEPAQPVPRRRPQEALRRRLQLLLLRVGNLARTFNASGDAKAVVEPYQETEKRGTRTLTSQEMAAQFVRETQDVESFEANGRRALRRAPAHAHLAEDDRALLARDLRARRRGRRGRRQVQRTGPQRPVGDDELHGGRRRRATARRRARRVGLARAHEGDRD